MTWIRSRQAAETTRAAANPSTTIRPVLHPAIVVASFLLLQLATPQPARAETQQATGRYVISVPSYDKRLVRVSAQITTGGDSVMMYPDGAGHVPEGWATYIRNLQATDADGAPVTLEYLGNGQWRSEATAGRVLNLEYEVLIHHDAGPWPFGWDEAAYVKGDAAFYTGKALFITALDVTDATIEFRIPESWQLITPWRPEGSGRRFVASDAINLTEAAILTGRFEQREIAAGDVTILLGVGKRMADSVPLFEEAIRSTVHCAASVFGGTPGSQFVVIANREEAFTGGGSFPRSLSMLFQEAPAAENRGEWSHVLVHEILHLWVGGAIRAQEPQEYWFTEGFTDYLTNLVQLRGGMITETQFWSRIAKHYGKYLPAEEEVSLRAAGDDKAKHYDLVYSGGLLAALALDVEIRSHSNGTAGIEHLMRELFRMHGDGQTPLRVEDVERAASRLADADLSSFFQRHIVGRDRLDVASALRAFGMQLQTTDGGPSIVESADPSAEAVQRRHDLVASGPCIR